MKDSLFFILFLFFVIGCQSQQQQVEIAELSHVNDYVFSLDSNDTKVPMQPFYNENTKTISFWTDSEITRKLYIYQHSEQKLQNKIHLPITRKQQVWAVNYYREDSIFIVLNAAKNTGYTHDSTILLIGKDTKIKKAYSLDALPIWNKHSRRINKDSVSCIVMKYGNLLVQANEIFVQLEPYSANVGDTLFEQVKFYAGASLNVLDGGVSLHPISSPSYTNLYYPKRAKVPAVAIDGKNNALYGFSHTSIVYKHDFVNNTISKYRANSVFGDSILPFLDKPATLPQEDYSQISYEKMYYHPTLCLFFRFVRLPLPSDASPEEKRNPYISILFFNEDIEKVGEAILPRDLKMVCYCTEKGIAFWNKAETEKMKNSVCFSEYSVSFKKGSMDELKMQLYSKDINPPLGQGIESYVFGNFDIKKEKSVVFFMPLNLMCKNCIDDIMRTYMEKSEHNSDVYLILGANEAQALIKFREDLGLKNDKNVRNDDKSIFRKYLNPPILNGNLLFIENGKIVSDMPLIPENLKLMDKNISEFLRKK